jgi:hypothetical protein
MVRRWRLIGYFPIRYITPHPVHHLPPQATAGIQFQLPPYFALLSRAVSILEGIALYGDADYRSIAQLLYCPLAIRMGLAHLTCTPNEAWLSTPRKSVLTPYNVAIKPYSGVNGFLISQ